MELVLIVLLVALAVYTVVSPLRRGNADAAEASESAERAELNAARDAKYREIRDAELDFRTGKLSEGDWREQDRGLRHEAVDILRRLDELDGREAGAIEVSSTRA